MAVYQSPALRVVLLIYIVAAIADPSTLYARGQSDKKGVQTPAQPAETPVSETPMPEPETEDSWAILAGTDEGLFSINSAGRSKALWYGGSVKKILRASAGGDIWVTLGSEGVLISSDLENWEPRNQGLPVKTIKIFRDSKKTFLPMVQDIKDLSIDSTDPNIMTCATKDRVYLSRDQGLSWTSLGAPPYRTNGIKAVASVYMPGKDDAAGGELVVFLSHSTYGIFYIRPNRANAQWVELIKGLETLETTGNPDEVADIAVNINANGQPEIYVSQTFRRRIYRLDWDQKSFGIIWSDDSPFGTVDSLAAEANSITFLYEGTVASLDFTGSALQKRQDIIDDIRSVPIKARLNCAALRKQNIILSELWLLDEPEPDNETVLTAPPARQAAGREGLYLPVNHSMDSRSMKPYLDVIEKGGLNMIVIDMKDDYGRLRFTPNNAAITEKGRVFRPLDIDAFLQDMKDRGVYTVARVVVFKDPELAGKENGRFAVWDARTAKPWVGYYDTRRKKTDISNEDRRNRLLQFFPAQDSEYEIVRTFYDERWVDPYSEEVWEYTAAVAEELHERGFDEIQFDYIRFPTDGDNLANARYRWQENDMDMESAMLSFLRHIRGRVKAPISIDIYGANGWYRTGARTGQEVELLAPWVDIICPMYYPSHFEQHFLAQNPPELRPRRIYFTGTLRTSRIGRGQAIIRPYVQAFFLNVSYDRKYYNIDYVRRQIEGVRAAGDGGLTYWNNSGRYEDIPAKTETQTVNQ